MARTIILITAITIIAAFQGCYKPVFNDPNFKLEPTQEEINVERDHLRHDQAYSSSFMRGYNDGYGGRWIAPLKWTVANDYRAGWIAGKRDRKADLPHFFLDRQ